MYSGGGDSTTGRFDCLSRAATCPVTSRLRARFAAFDGSSRPMNAGAGSFDPVCRGCQTPFSNATVKSIAIQGNGASVIVDLSFGSPFPIAVLEVQEGGMTLVDDTMCVTANEPVPSTSLYLVTNPAC